MDIQACHDDDRGLLQAVARGEAVSVRRLLDEVAPVVYGFLYARVGGNQAAAEDLLQETLLEAVRSASSFRGDSALSTWLCAIGRRRLARHYEAERRAEVVRRGLRAVEGGRDTDDAGVERRDQVVRALGTLPALHRQVLVHKYMDDMSVEDIATALGRSRVQVQSLLQRARESMRKAVGDDHD